MSLPGYKAFTMAAKLFADLFPDRTKVIDGDDKEMVLISEALDEACEYGEKSVDEDGLRGIVMNPGHEVVVHAIELDAAVGVLEMDEQGRIIFRRFNDRAKIQLSNTNLETRA